MFDDNMELNTSLSKLLECDLSVLPNSELLQDLDILLSYDVQEYISTQLYEDSTKLTDIIFDDIEVKTNSKQPVRRCLLDEFERSVRLNSDKKQIPVITDKNCNEHTNQCLFELDELDVLDLDYVTYQSVLPTKHSFLPKFGATLDYYAETEVYDSTNEYYSECSKYCAHSDYPAMDENCNISPNNVDIYNYHLSLWMSNNSQYEISNVLYEIQL